MGIKIHVGSVTDNNDPEKRGRVKFKCETLLGDQEHPEWADPIGIGIGGGAGILVVPEVGAPIEVEVDDADSEYTPRYRGGTFTDNQAVPDELKEGYPKRRGIKTPGETVILIDDTPGSEMLLITDKNGNTIEVKKDQVTVKATGTKLLLEGPNIDVGDGAQYNIPYAQTLYAKLNSQFSMLGGHYHMVSSEGAPTGPMIPRPPAFPSADSWSSPTVKVK